MKMIKISLILILILTISCKSINQNFKNDKNDLQNLDLKGHVKSCHETIYEAVEELGKILKGEKKNGNELTDIFYSFNKKGYLTESRKFDYSGNICWIETYSYYKNDLKVMYNLLDGQNKIYLSFTYKYDPSGQLIEEVRQDYFQNSKYKINYKYNPNGKLVEESWYYDKADSINFKVNYTYDDNGNLIEEKKTHQDGRIFDYYNTYRYDKSNNEIEHNVFKPDGRLDYRTTYTYNRSSIVLEKMMYNSEGKLTDKSIFSYKKNGKIIEEDFRNYQHNTWVKSIDQYDKYGNLIKESIERSFLPKNDSTIYSLEYDNKKNWIRQITYSRSKPTQLQERIIEYF